MSLGHEEVDKVYNPLEVISQESTYILNELNIIWLKRGHFP